MDLKDINLDKYKIEESQVITESDKLHLKNYTHIIKFIEASIADSANKKDDNYRVLLEKCIQCIRYLDNLLHTYNVQNNIVAANNNLVETLKKDLKAKKKEEPQKSKDISESDQKKLETNE